MRKPPGTRAFAETFATLRGILDRHREQLRVLVDKPGDYRVASPTLADRTGRPLFVAAVQVKKNYVSFHLMPVYTDAELRDQISPALSQRMQGKSCFNFTTIAPADARELAALTREGLSRFERIELPWAPPQERRR